MQCPSRKYRAPAFGHTDPDADPLDTAINSAATFFSTAGNAAHLHGVDRQHLLDTLRLAGQRDVPVTARLIYDTAANLATSGYRATGTTGPSPAELEREASEARRAKGQRGAQRGPRDTAQRRQPVVKRGVRPLRYPMPAHSFGR